MSKLSRPRSCCAPDRPWPPGSSSVGSPWPVVNRIFGFFPSESWRIALVNSCSPLKPVIFGGPLLRAAEVDLGEVVAVDHPLVVAARHHHARRGDAVLLDELLRLQRILLEVDHPHVHPPRRRAVALEQLGRRLIQLFLLLGRQEDDEIDVAVEPAQDVPGALRKAVELALRPVETLVVLPAEIVEDHQQHGEEKHAGGEGAGAHQRAAPGLGGLLGRIRSGRHRAHLHFLSASARLAKNRKNRVPER